MPLRKYKGRNSVSWRKGRKSASKGRTLRSKRKTSAKMTRLTKKKLLNLTSTKKRDTMLHVTNTSAANPSGSSTYNRNSPTLVAGPTYMFPWIATWRDTTQAEGLKMNQASRSSQTCYMRGLKEKVLCVTNDGTEWLWRRICFTWRGSELYGNSTAGYTLATRVTTEGFARTVNDVNITTNPVGTRLAQILFKGAAGIDWNNYFTAPLDTSYITVKYDKTRSIRSGNQNGRTTTRSFWHPMNKNLVYNDDESGPFTLTQGPSTRAKAGMGDYYVIDIISTSSPQNTTTSQLQWIPEATLYWAEK